MPRVARRCHGGKTVFPKTGIPGVGYLVLLFVITVTYIGSQANVSCPRRRASSPGIAVLWGSEHSGFPLTRE